MTFRSGLISGFAAAIFLMGAVAVGWWVELVPRFAPARPTPTPPAKVGKVLKEDEINGMKLTPEAVARLGIRTVPIAKKAMGQIRRYGGEVTIPAGQLIAVAAPLGGTLQEPFGGIPAAGMAVRKGQVIVQLLPLLTPESRTTIATARVDADGQVNNARTQLDAARIALDRAKNMLKNQAGSQRSVDEAQEKYDLAAKSLEARTASRDMLVRVSGEAERGTAAPIPLAAPQDGLLRSVSALNGQNVPSGAALFEIEDLSRVWIRVPVYVGDKDELSLTADALVGNVSGRAEADMQRATPVAAPPSANAASATVDLFYAMDNRVARFAPGQRVAVAVPVRGEAESLVVPWSAVIHDIHGGTWVYEQSGPQSYVRRRVQVRHVADALAVLASGPAVGVEIVVEGAAELFGAEVGFSK